MKCLLVAQGAQKSFIQEERFPVKKFTIEIAVLVLLAKDPSVYLGVRSIINKGLTTAAYWRIRANSDLGNDLNIQ